MRNTFMLGLGLATVLASPWVLAQDISVQAHSLMRLPGNSSVLRLDRLEVADYGTLLVPGGVTEVNVEQLVLGHESRIAIVPSPQPFKIAARRGELGDGSEITARGAPGTFEKPALPGRNLTVRLERLDAGQVSVDARGGAGAPGYVGLDGAGGKEPGCTWGAAGRGFDGDDGGNGHDGAAGGQVRLELPVDYPVSQVKVLVAGGAGGEGGAGGKGGKGGASKGCIVYRADGGKAGKTGATGQPGAAGSAGSVTVAPL